MGYYTWFELQHTNKSKKELDEKEILLALAEINPNYFTIYTNEGYKPYTSLDDVFCEELKWYDYEDDMEKLSEKFPTEMFILYGKGEEAEDYWKQYFYNGNTAYCQGDIVYREQNARLLWEEYNERSEENTSDNN